MRKSKNALYKVLSRFNLLKDKIHYVEIEAFFLVEMFIQYKKKQYCKSIHSAQNLK